MSLLLAVDISNTLIKFGVFRYAEKEAAGPGGALPPGRSSVEKEAAGPGEALAPGRSSFEKEAAGPGEALPPGRSSFELVSVWRASTVQERTEDELAFFIDGTLEREELSLRTLDAMVIGSVVPRLTAAFQRLGERYLRQPTLIIGPGIKTGVRLRVDNPAEVGADRIANTLAAHRLYGGPAIVIDFGTSTNFDCVSADGDFLGGAFAPGLEVASESLFSRAARLFRVPLVVPEKAIGKNTAACLQSGVMFGYIGLVEGMVARLKRELAEDAKVIGTGGLVSIIAPHTAVIEKVDEALTLQGLRMLWELNR